MGGRSNELRTYLRKQGKDLARGWGGEALPSGLPSRLKTRRARKAGAYRETSHEEARPCKEEKQEDVLKRRPYTG